MSALYGRIIRQLCRRLSPLTERFGFVLSPVHFYFPIPDSRDLKRRDVWNHRTSLSGIDWNESGQLELIKSFSDYGHEPDWKPGTGDPTDGYRPDASTFGYTSAMLAYAMVRHFKPAKIMEIGCGWSTLALLEAVRKNEEDSESENHEANVPTKKWKGYLGFDPYPPAWLDHFTSEHGNLKRSTAQQIPFSTFDQLNSGDVLFIDSTHVLNIGSDVQYLFLEVLPRLNPGVVVHIHDIQLPWEYPRSYALGQRWFWNEQYLLQAFLAHNRDYEILAAGQWLCIERAEELGKSFPNYDSQKHGPTGSFWIRRKV